MIERCIVGHVWRLDTYGVCPPGFTCPNNASTSRPLWRTEERSEGRSLFQEIVLQLRRLTLIPSPAAGLLIK
jgi:hypothetical protein